MKYDLYKSYKQIYQRWSRDPSNLKKSELKDLAHNLVKRQPPRDEMIAITDKMLEIELQIPGFRRIYSSEMKRAIEANEYVINVPNCLRPAWDKSRLGESDDGYVYVATALSRPGWSKLGWTGDKPEKRVRKYLSRYGYKITVFWSVKICDPFEFEAEMARRLSHLRVATVTYDDSNEWYRMTGEELQTAVTKALQTDLRHHEVMTGSGRDPG